MIPLQDDAPRWGFPGVTLVFIVINCAIFLYQFSLYVESPRLAAAFVETYGAIPVRTTAALAGRASLIEGLGPVFTSIFLHGGWMHLIGNMWFLWIFGDNIEDELGHLNYLVFYIGCGIIASLAHFFSDPQSTLPSVGASGAIAGVMGAYMIRFPTARIVTLIPFFFFFTTIEVPALIMLAYWFMIQFLSGAASYGVSDAGGVAWWAHTGGFVAGAILIWLKPRRRRSQRVRTYYDY